jgi:hypothetical protein
VDNLVAQLLGLRVGGVDVTDVDRLHRVFGCSAVAGHHVQLGGLGVGIAEARDPAEVERLLQPEKPDTEDVARLGIGHVEVRHDPVDDHE